jgi:hypothetical protein
MKTSMLEYVKIILQKVSFNKRLFLKEYRKSYQWLVYEERKKLKEWIRSQRSYTRKLI